MVFKYVCAECSAVNCMDIPLLPGSPPKKLKCRYCNEGDSVFFGRVSGKELEEWEIKERLKKESYV